MTEREKLFIKCVKQDPIKAAKILKIILDLRKTSSKIASVHLPTENEIY